MLISCPSCDTRFNVDPAAIGDAGRQVRCAKCAHVWHATLPGVDEEEEQYAAGGSLEMDDIDLGEDQPEDQA